jgi:hypothetical protein
MNQLEMTQLEAKIEQLPPQLQKELNHYVDQLLQKYSVTTGESTKKPLRSLKHFRSKMPKTTVSSVDLVQQLRDEGY